MISCDIVKKLKPHVNFIPVCPEVEIGLGIPRETLRIVSMSSELRLIQPTTGLDFTDRMLSFAKAFLDSLLAIDGFILKNGSPSSALKEAKIYRTVSKSAPIGKGPGLFRKMAIERFGSLAIEDEKRLTNQRIRDHFLKKLFALASLRQVRTSGSISELVRFHSENKLLLTAYSQKELNILGRIVANREKKSFYPLIEEYERHFYEAMRIPPRYVSNVNVLTKAFGYVSKKLSREEKRFFADTLEKYRKGIYPIVLVSSILKA